MNNELMLVQTTCGTLSHAKAIARRLVEERLAACCHIMPITSCYRWHGTIEETDEVVVQCTTLPNRVNEVVAFLKANHPYKVPQIIITAVESRNQEYTTWVEEEGG